MLRIRHTTALLAGIVPAVALGPAVSPAPAPASSPPRPAVVQSSSASALRIAVRHHFGQLGNASGYAVIIVTGRHQAWVFGGTNPGGQSAPVAALWNGSRTLPSKLPARLTGFISDASAPSPRDVWAVSQFGQYVLHWNGTRWQVARQWRIGQISGLVAIDAHDVWIFGTTTTGFRGLGTWHFDGRSWTNVSGQASAIIRASSLSRRDIWAVAEGTQTDSILRFNGSVWRQVATHGVLQSMRPHDILAISDHNVWVIGDSTGKYAGRLALVHWNGRTWYKIVTPIHAWAGRLASGPHSGVLVTATPVSLAANGLILQVSASGKLSASGIEAGLGSGVSDVVLAGGAPALMWATGGVLTRLGGDAAIWTGRLPQAIPNLDPES